MTTAKQRGATFRERRSNIFPLKYFPLYVFSIAGCVAVDVHQMRAYRLGCLGISLLHGTSTHTHLTLHINGDLYTEKWRRRYYHY